MIAHEVMRLRCLATVVTMAMAMPTFLGCGGGTTTPSPQALEIEGTWLFLGGSSASDPGHDLTIARGSMSYEDIDGKWSSKWTIKASDNGLHHFQVAFDSGVGTYLPVGQSLSGAYDLSGVFLTVLLANGFGSYPKLQGTDGCTRETDGMPLPDCRLYAKQD